MDVESTEDKTVGEKANFQKYFKLYTQAQIEHAQWKDLCDDAWAEFSHARYSDIRKATGSADARGLRYKANRFPIFWSSIKVLQPAIYARNPQPAVKRRFNDEDPVGRTACTVSNRLGVYMMDSQPFGYHMRLDRDDLLITSRCVGRVYLEADIVSVPLRVDLQPIMGEQTFDEQGQPIPAQPIGFMDIDGKDVTGVEVEQDATGFFYMTEEQDVESQKICFKYVNRNDFFHTPGARTLDEVNEVMFRYYYCKDEAIEAFGKEIADKLVYSHDEPGKDTAQTTLEKIKYAKGRAEILEIWCKEDKEVYWISPDYKDGILKEEEDPYQLDGFFPCVLAYDNQTPDSLYPTPFYVQVRDIIEQCHFLMNRINRLTRALRVRGIYDAETPELRSLFTETGELDLVGVEGMRNFLEKGGLQQLIQTVDLDPIAKSLQSAYQAMSTQIDYFYQITGISDIIRGISDPNETATAQQIKGKFATLRIAELQDKMQQFAKDALAKMLDLAYSKGGLSDDMIALSIDKAGMTQEEQASFDKALKLLRQDKLRSFRLDIETDSTLAVDENQDKQAATELIQTVANAAGQVGPLAQQSPAMAKVLSESIMALVRVMKQAKSIEPSMQAALDSVVEEAAQNKQAAQQAQAQAQQQPPEEPNTDVMRVQLDGQKLQVDAQAKQQELMLKEREVMIREREVAIKEAETQIKAQEVGLNFEKIRADAATQIEALKEQSRQAAIDAQLAVEKISSEERSKSAQVAVQAQASAMQAQLDAQIKKMQEETKLQIAQLEKESKDTISMITAQTNDLKLQLEAHKLSFEQMAVHKAEVMSGTQATINDLQPRQPRVIKVVRGADGLPDGYEID